MAWPFVTAPALTPRTELLTLSQVGLAGYFLSPGVGSKSSIRGSAMVKDGDHLVRRSRRYVPSQLLHIIPHRSKYTVFPGIFVDSSVSILSNLWYDISIMMRNRSILLFRERKWRRGCLRAPAPTPNCPTRPQSPWGLFHSTFTTHEYPRTHRSTRPLIFSSRKSMSGDKYSPVTGGKTPTKSRARTPAKKAAATPKKTPAKTPTKSRAKTPSRSTTPAKAKATPKAAAKVTKKTARSKTPKKSRKYTIV